MAVRRDRAGSAVYGQFGAVRVAVNEMERWRLAAWVGLIGASFVGTDAGANLGVHGDGDGTHLGPRRCRAYACAFMRHFIDVAVQHTAGVLATERCPKRMVLIVCILKVDYIQVSSFSRALSELYEIDLPELLLLGGRFYKFRKVLY